MMEQYINGKLSEASKARATSFENRHLYRQQTTDNGQQAADDGQKTTEGGQPTTEGGQQTTDKEQQAKETSDNGQKKE